METTSGANTGTPRPEPAAPTGVQAARAVAEFPGELCMVFYLMGELAAVEAALYREIPLTPHPLQLDEACDELDAVNRSMVMNMLRSFDLGVSVMEPGYPVNAAAVPLAAIYWVIRAPKPLPGASLTLVLWSRNSLEHLTYSFIPLSLGGSGESIGSVGAGVHGVLALAEIQEKMGWRLYIFQSWGHFFLDLCH